MRLHGARQLGGIASFRPMFEKGEPLLGGERLQARIVFEKTLERLHEGRAARMLQKD